MKTAGVASGARFPAGRKYEHAPGGNPANERVPLIDDDTGVRIEAAPESHRDVRRQRFSSSRAGGNSLASETLTVHRLA
jgi:hypothetical protein